MSQVVPYHLWIGHAGDGTAFRELFSRNIRAVVQLAAEEPPSQPPRELLFLRLPLMDGQGNESEILQLAITVVALLIEKNIPTLVCCGAGMSRSPCIAAAALTAAGKGSFEECLTQVTAHHPADISPGLCDDVRHILRQMHHTQA